MKRPQRAQVAGGDFHPTSPHPPSFSPRLIYSELAFLIRLSSAWGEFFIFIPPFFLLKSFFLCLVAQTCSLTEWSGLFGWLRGRYSLRLFLGFSLCRMERTPFVIGPSSSLLWTLRPSSLRWPIRRRKETMSNWAIYGGYRGVKTEKALSTTFAHFAFQMQRTNGVFFLLNISARR